MRKHISIILILVFASSCTITKRVHRKGWHVEWRSSLKKNQANSESEKISRPNEATFYANDERPSSKVKFQIADEKEEQSVLIAEKIHEKRDETYSQDGFEDSEMPQDTIYPMPPKQNRESQKIKSENTQSAALGFIIAGLVLGIIAVLVYLLITNFVYTLLSLLLAVLTIVVVVILAIILLIVGLILLGVDTSKT